MAVVRMKWLGKLFSKEKYCSVGATIGTAAEITYDFVTEGGE